MEVFEAVRTVLAVREFQDKPVSPLTPRLRRRLLRVAQPGLCSPAAQIPGRAVIFGQHPSFAAVTTREVRIVRRGLRRSRVAARYLQPVDHAAASRPELAGVGALVARLAQLSLLNHGLPTPLFR